MSTRRALLFSFLDRYSALIISIGSSMIIARMLTPAEIGVFSVTMVLILFISALRDLGAGQYLVQVKELTSERVRATWTVLLLTGWFMALVVAAAAWPVASFYREPRMVDIMLVIAANFAINPFGSMTYAWLMREMRFDALAVMRFGSSLSGAVVSVLLAWRGWGPLSLAVGNFGATLVNALIALRFRPSHFAWWPAWSGVRQVVGFGSKISANSLVTTMANGAPELVLGRLQGLASAGFYSRSFGLSTMFQRLLLDAAQAVALPLLAREQRERGSVGAPFLKVVAFVTATGWSFFGGLILMAHPLTRLLYGNQWDNSVPVTRLIAAGMSLMLPAVMCAPALMAAGRPGVMLRCTLGAVSIQVVCVAMGACFGLLDAALGFAVSQIFAVAIWLRASRVPLDFGWASLARVLRCSAVVAGATAMPPLVVMVSTGLDSPPALGPMLLSIAGGALAFVWSARAVAHPIRDEIDHAIRQATRLVRRAP